MKIGIFGGTFDPIHNGHIYLAEKVSARLSLSRVIFVPAYIPPHKTGKKITSAKHRYNMLKLAIRNNRKLAISDIELKRKGKSYSIETIKIFKEKYGPKVELVFMAGSDLVSELYKWKDLDEILKNCCFIVIERPGFKMKKDLNGILVLKIKAKGIQSTDIRNGIRNNKPLKGVMPEKVLEYIKKHELYT
jgi:nicotinate-nucleotide adenylyltransferase